MFYKNLVGILKTWLFYNSRTRQYINMENTFKIGETVVCINAKKRWYKLGDLKENEMYTVIGFNPYDGGLVLREVKSRRSGYHAYAADRFRKIDYAFAERILAEIQPKVKPQIQKQPQPQRTQRRLKPQLSEYALSILN